jgi:hypothetical protein
MSSNGTNAVKSYPGPLGSLGWDASWSPDGPRLVFRKAASLHTINVDGSGDTPITFAGVAEKPDWSR